MGDSLTEGYEIDISRRWTDLLQEELGLEILNSGISGDTTAGMLSRFHQMVIVHNPSHVIILGGTNDLWFGVSQGIVVSNILAMTKLARHHGIISIIGLPTLFYPEIASSYSDIFMGAHSFLDNLISFRNKLKEVADSKELLVLDFAKGMTSDMVLVDGVHPNESGHEIMMRNALSELKLIFSKQP